MSNNIEVSIIIPTYNLEKYICATIESVILQDGITKEVLIVDDFSTDKTREIVQAYVTQYPYIKLLQNERAKGVSGARNTGITHMRGESCFFLDGDDLLPANALKPLVQYMNENNVLLVCGTSSLLCHQRWIYLKQNFVAKSAATEYPTGTFAKYLYNSAFIKNNSILFPEDCLAGEDRTFFCNVFALLPVAMAIPTLDHCVYIYRINHKKNIPTVKHALSFAKHFTYVRELLEKNNKMQFYPSYIKLQFVNEWLGRAFYAQESDESMHEYLELCAKALTGMQDKLGDDFKAILQEKNNTFWDACNRLDTQVMLEIAKNSFEFKQISSYVAIHSNKVNSSHWEVVKILYRIISILKAPRNIKQLLYIFILEKKAKKFCKLQNS